MTPRLLAVALMLSGCLSMRIAQVRDTTTSILGCPTEKITVRETEKGWVAGGCDKWVVCSDTTGPCIPMVCADVAMSDYRDCQEKHPGREGDCLSMYTNATRACVVEEIKGVVAPAAPAKETAASTPSERRAASSTPQDPKVAGGIGAGDVVDVFVDKGETYIRAGRTRGVGVGSQLVMLGDRIGDTEEYRPSGAATVIEVFDTIARVAPDDDAKKTPAKKARFAATQVEEQLVLKGRLKRKDDDVVLSNDTSFQWRNCEVRMPMKRLFGFRAGTVIEPGTSKSMPAGNFENDDREPDQYMQQGYALVRCREAQGYVWWGKQGL